MFCHIGTAKQKKTNKQTKPAHRTHIYTQTHDHKVYQKTKLPKREALFCISFQILV